jgi:hypothetical protein
MSRSVDDCKIEILIFFIVSIVDTTTGKYFFWCVIPFVVVFPVHILEHLLNTRCVDKSVKLTIVDKNLSIFYTIE